MLLYISFVHFFVMGFLSIHLAKHTYVCMYVWLTPPYLLPFYVHMYLSRAICETQTKAIISLLILSVIDLMKLKRKIHRCSVGVSAFWLTIEDPTYSYTCEQMNCFLIKRNKMYDIRSHIQPHKLSHRLLN